jgi:hypothetical protein
MGGTVAAPAEDIGPTLVLLTLAGGSTLPVGRPRGTNKRRDAVRHGAGDRPSDQMPSPASWCFEGIVPEGHQPMRPVRLAWNRFEVVSAFRVYPVDDRAHDPDVVVGEIGAALAQDGQYPLPGQGSRLVRQCLDVGLG